MKNFSFYKELFLILFLSLSSVCQGQPPTIDQKQFKKAIDFLPPAPNAAAIAKAALFSINKNTGSPQINIPLQSAKGNKAEVKIALTYATNGIKVNESPSNVGMGWVLTAGGVISRVVNGWPDETHKRILPWEPIGTGWGTVNFCIRVTDSATKAWGYDSQPDFFTFNVNGFSGSFILDENLEPILIPVSNYKVVINNLSPTVNDNITIVAPDGTKYFFGGGVATEKSKRVVVTPLDFTTPVPSSWHLTRIIYPNGERVDISYVGKELTYNTNIDQFVCQTGGTSSVQGGCNGVEFEPPTPGTSSILGYEITQFSNVAQIHTISVNQGQSFVEFTYLERPQSQQNLVKSIIYRQNIEGSSIYKQYTLDYNMEGYDSGPLNGYLNGNAELTSMPYLSYLRESGSSQEENQSLTHRFSYLDPSSRCPRLSFAQDHWGYFNGKPNTTLIPPHKAHLAHPISIANADREPDFEFAQKGMLSKIIYPTGGIEQIVYEPNTVSDFRERSTKNEYSCSITGIRNSPTDISTETTKEIPFSINAPQEIVVDAVLDCSECTVPDHQVGTIKLINSLGEVFSGITSNINGNSFTLTYINVPAGQYKLVLMAKPLGITSATLRYKGEISSVEYERPSGGVRVKQVLKGNNTEIPEVTTYQYGEIDSPNKSSNANSVTPVYEENYSLTINMLISTSYQMCTYTGTTEFFQMYSNSIFNLFGFSNSLPSYRSVIESKGKNYEYGVTQTHYFIQGDLEAFNVWGTKIANATTCNSSILGNGNIAEEIIYKIGVNGQLFPLNKKKYIYEWQDPRLSKQMSFYIVRKHNVSNYTMLYDTTCLTSECLPNMINSLDNYDIDKYILSAPWNYVKEIEEISYDENGQNPQTSTTTFTYANSDHQQISESKSINSKGDIVRIHTTYPHDHINETVYAGMVSDHIIISPITTSSTKDIHGNIITVASSKNNYINWRGLGTENRFELGSVEASVKGMPLDTQGIINQRNNCNNITQYTGKDGVTNSIYWGYGGIYPIMKVSGMSLQQLAALPGNPVDGVENLIGDQILERSNFLRNILDGLAFVEAYTYLPFVGITSKSDMNGKITSYNYDEFGRLKQVKDNEGNILKDINYSYAGADLNHEFKIFWNEPVPINVKCGPCSQFGTVGTTEVYTVPAHTYFSFNSVAEANTIAEQSEMSKAVLYANEHGRCTNALQECTGTGYQMVGCNCELGTIECEGNVVELPDGQFQANYHYHYSDNTNSQSMQGTFPVNPCPNN